MKIIAIVDYGLCNLDSVARAVALNGGQPLVTQDPRDLARAERIILPGVGAFPRAMQNLHKFGLVKALEDQVRGKGIPILGVCLGMHLLAAVGQEVEETPGLGWIQGEVKRMVPKEPGERIPHIGWNEVEYTQPSALFANISSGTNFYFVHSFHLSTRRAETVIGTSPYCGGFAAAVAEGNIFGVQFHPEKSQRLGLRLIQNFLSL
jgi:imidazole glycerol-phosphate synthase subunit HisH